MKKQFSLLAFLTLNILPVFAQDLEPTESDSEYLEDQFYMGVGYNILTYQPSEVVQQNFSYNLQLGFLKDIPLNNRRNVGLGIGLGYAINAYYSNLVASQTNNGVEYEIVSDSINRSKVGTHSIELPIEFRWRTSTPDTHKFWRIYGGFKLSYNFSAISKVVLENGKIAFDNPQINKWQPGLILNLGYNTFNFHAYYGLNTIFNDEALLNGEQIKSRVFRIGIMFYIL